MIKESPFVIRKEVNRKSRENRPEIILDKEIVEKLKQIVNWDQNKLLIKPNESNQTKTGSDSKLPIDKKLPIVEVPVPKKFPKTGSEPNGTDCTGDVCIPCLLPRAKKTKLDEPEVKPEAKKKRKMIHPPKQLLRVSDKALPVIE